MRANFEGKRKAARNAIQRLPEMETAKKKLLTVKTRSSCSQRIHWNEAEVDVYLWEVDMAGSIHSTTDQGCNGRVAAHGRCTISTVTSKAQLNTMS